MVVAVHMTPALLAGVPMPTPIEWVQLIVLSAIPIGLFLVLRKTRQIRWPDLLRASGVLVVPTVVVLVLNDALSPTATALVLGTVLAYVMALIDTD